MTKSWKKTMEQSVGAQQLHRGLGKRHIQLIAIGGAIGTGLFMGTGKTISVSGTSIIFTYLLVGFFAFMVMRAMGEILLSNLAYRSFVDFVADYLGEKASYFMGWTYWMSWIVTCIADVVICGGYIQYWYPDISLWLTALFILGSMFLCNFFSVQIFGETEFWFAMIKVLAIIALIIVSVGMVIVGWTSPNGVTASIRHLTESEVFLPYGVLGFLAGFQIAIFSFTGIELIGMVAAETKEPKKVLPKAINSIPIRVIIFYVLSMVCIIAVTSWPYISPSVSSFVTLFALAGLPAAAAVINFVALTSAMSSANSGLYACTRMLYSLSTEKLAHSKFGMLSIQSSVPTFSLIFSVLCMVSGIFLLFIIPDVMKLFTIVSTVAAIMVIYNWCMILFAYLVYREKRPDLHKVSIYKMPVGIPMTYITLIFFAFTVVIMILDYDTRIALYGSAIWFFILEIFWWKRKSKNLRL
ncbi:amino acid permease [Xenorhabdus sp. ZM]|uniref:amino acid permease n=1 Tax=Xenorhabdus szentirmaii TaxID=290112 RepID=UPI00199003A8|nr:amino acid permease [Xenorhabdus sp. ZM]MBD2804274.1 amino acid permease [Xenorhabdus sp. ZM]